MTPRSPLVSFAAVPHVHPRDEGLAFETHLPSAGRYRLVLPYRTSDRVGTAASPEVGR